MELQLSLYPQPQPSFHNTIHLEGEELKQAELNAQSQDGRVYEVFKDGKARTAWDVQDQLPNMLITSIRRSLTNLTVRDFLEKTENMVMGKYKTKCHQYKLNKI